MKSVVVRRFLAFMRFCLWSALCLVACAGLLFAWFVYTPAPAVPRLSGTLSKGSIEVAGVKRTYLTYVPQGLARGAPLVVVMHGSGQNGARVRIETGHAFDRLAEEHRFAVVYPNAHEGYWDACSVVGAIEADTHGVDDMAFLTGMVDQLIAAVSVDPGRVFAVGSSRGGSMALRLALEAPARFRAVAAVSASVPTPDNFKCRTPGQSASSVMIMNGTKDPIVPFEGGEVSLFGLFYRNGNMLSSRESGQFLRHSTTYPELQKATKSPWRAGFASSTSFGATSPRRRLNWWPFTAVDTEYLSLTSGAREFWVLRPWSRTARH